MFFARWELGAPWNSSGIDGTMRWLRRVWAMVLEPGSGKADADTIRGLRRKVHQTVQQLTRDFENLQFNTTVSGLMELLNEMVKAKQAGAYGTKAWDEAIDIYLRMLAPIAPHIAEELWAELGKPYSVHTQAWPEADEEAAAEDEITLIVQINGKLRDRIVVPVGISKEEAKAMALASDKVARYLEGKEPRKVIVVPGRLVNIVL
jgi:leucyl-tRNA synthetase